MRGAAPISLYLELKPDTLPDLEVVAGAAKAFAELVREVAYIIDPSLDVRIEFDSGTPTHSLNINARLRGLWRGAMDPKVLFSIVLVVSAWFKDEIKDWVAQRILDKLLDAPAEHVLTDDDLKKVAETVEKAIKKNAGKPQAQQVYRELERDTGVTGVGLSSRPNERPESVVPRTEFMTRASSEIVSTTQTTRRKIPYQGPLVLVSPVLLQGDRKWKFRGPFGEFGAYVDDDGFVAKVLAGRVRMTEGMIVNVDMSTSESFDGQVWQRGEVHIEKVRSVRRAPDQPSLPLTKPKQPARKRENRRK